MIKKGEKIVVGLSGGVDSFVALILLKKQGWQPVAVSLKLPVWQDKRNVLRENICCTKESCKRARNIAEKLAVPYFIFDARKDFQKKVVHYFISEFSKGRTPNPCVVCNRCLKFRKLFEFAKKHHIKYVATGHYAQTKRNPKTDEYEFLKAKDKIKDQTYFLSFLPQKWLGSIVFPLGNLTKKEVEQIAKKEGFDFWAKTAIRQSQDFCYVAGKSLHSFLEERVGKKPGKIVDSKGKVLAEHRGLHFYTIGQRKGLKLTGGPYFVKALEGRKNLLIVSKNKKEVSQKEIILRPFHFISGGTPKRKTLVIAKTRYSQAGAKATLYPAKNGKLKIIFEKPQFAVTPGQFCVFYQNNICLGAGVIN